MLLDRAAALPAWVSLDVVHSSHSLWQPLSTALSMQLGITCVILFVGATAAGLLPLLISIPEKQVRAFPPVRQTTVHIYQALNRVLVLTKYRTIDSCILHQTEGGMREQQFPTRCTIKQQ